MKMTFIGKDGSMGYKKGKTYNNEVYISEGYLWIRTHVFLDTISCPYSNPEKLKENWNFLTVENEKAVTRAWGGK